MALLSLLYVLDDTNFTQHLQPPPTVHCRPNLSDRLIASNKISLKVDSQCQLLSLSLPKQTIT